LFSLEAMRTLRNARPFVPFRLWLSDGGHVDVPTPEVVLLGRHFAIIGLLDPKATDTAVDRYTTVWYLHVTRHEMLSAGVPPFSSSSGPSETPVATPG
jgi:hypothetical protein